MYSIWENFIDNKSLIILTKSICCTHNVHGHCQGQVFLLNNIQYRTQNEGVWEYGWKIYTHERGYDRWTEEIELQEDKSYWHQGKQTRETDRCGFTQRLRRLHIRAAKLLQCYHSIFFCIPQPSHHFFLILHSTQLQVPNILLFVYSRPESSQQNLEHRRAFATKEKHDNTASGC